jgi:arylsulfatase A-like enzyme
LESFDYNALGYEVNGEEVTPFLNQLRQRSLFYRIAAARYLGSADADFVMLGGVMPSLHMITYNIPNYPYENTLPQFLSRHGYRTSVFHGNTGNFYNRRGAFERMGFSEIHFREEMTRQDGLLATKWGVDDRDVLRLSARRLADAQGPTCHFIITLTTHTPYTLLPPDDREIYARPQSMAQDFLNNMRYLDRRLGEYIASLPPATIVIYSDHPADPAVAPEFKPHLDGVREFVPCFIFDTQTDLSEMQRTRSMRMSRDGSLTLLDISSYLRAQVARQAGAGAEPSPQAGADRSNDGAGDARNGAPIARDSQNSAAPSQNGPTGSSSASDATRAQ